MLCLICDRGGADELIFYAAGGMPVVTGFLTFWSLIAAPDLAKQLFNWQATRTIKIMCTSTHNWQSQNRRAYE